MSLNIGASRRAETIGSLVLPSRPKVLKIRVEAGGESDVWSRGRETSLCHDRCNLRAPRVNRGSSVGR